MNPEEQDIYEEFMHEEHQEEEQQEQQQQEQQQQEQQTNPVDLELFEFVFEKNPEGETKNVLMSKESFDLLMNKFSGV